MKQLLQVTGLTKHFTKKNQVVRAVDGISFDLKYGETLGLVGESGCGKSTTGRLVLDLINPTSGSVLFEGEDIFKFDRKDTLKFRRNAQIIFQDCFASLSPRMKAGDIINEALTIHHIGNSRKERNELIASVFSDVSLSREQMKRYPHEFSGGQRQRIGIARAICLKPKFIVCDEPVSALDVSIQAQIINMMKSIQEKYNLAYIFISHDLGVVKHISDRVAVMYLGKIVEIASKKDFYKNPLHPYSRALLSAIPVSDPEMKREKIILKSEANFESYGKCCRFADRCWMAKPICSEIYPEWKEVDKGHFTACHNY